MASPLDLCKQWDQAGAVPHGGVALLEAALRPLPNIINNADPLTGFTPLHYACKLQSLPLIKAILEVPGVKTSVPDEEGVIPLAVLLDTHGHPTKKCPELMEIVQQLARQPGAWTVDNKGNSALSLALDMCATLGPLYTDRRQLEEIVKSVSITLEISIRKDTSRTAVMICVLLRDRFILERVLDCNNPPPNLHATDKNGMTALHIAGKMGSMECGLLIANRDPSVCRVKDENGNTALFYFVAKLKARECLNLINNYNHWWDFDAINNLGEDIIDYYTTFNEAKRPEKCVIDALWCYGARSGERRKGKKRSPGTNTGSVLREPLDSIDARTRGSVPEAEDFKKNVQPLHVRLEEMKKVATLVTILCENSTKNTLDHCDSRGYTPLMYCAKLGLQQEAEALSFSHPGPEVNKVNRDQETALHIAAKYGKVGVMHTLLKWPGVKINEQDKKGNTALFYILEKFPHNETVNIIATYKWNFTKTNNQLELPGDYYVNTPSRQPAVQRRFAGPSKLDNTREKELLKLLKRWKSIHQEQEQELMQRLQLTLASGRVPDEHSDAPSTLDLGQRDSNVSDDSGTSADNNNRWSSESDAVNNHGRDSRDSAIAEEELGLETIPKKVDRGSTDASPPITPVQVSEGACANVCRTREPESPTRLERSSEPPQGNGGNKAPNREAKSDTGEPNMEDRRQGREF